jgi:hypothetical protein
MFWSLFSVSGVVCSACVPLVRRPGGVAPGINCVAVPVVSFGSSASSM